MSPSKPTPNECTCFWVDPKFWTTHYGAAEPGSQMEPNPECPVHFPKENIMTAIPRTAEEIVDEIVDELLSKSALSPDLPAEALALLESAMPTGKAADEQKITTALTGINPGDYIAVWCALYYYVAEIEQPHE